MNAIRTAQRNARLALAGTSFNSLAFILPIWLLYSVQEMHFSAAMATALFMCVWLTSGLLEVPTGALADRWGRKRTFVLGNMLLAIYPLAYAFEFSLVPLVVCSLASGLGSALQSGSLLPLVHKSYEQANLGQKAYNRFISNNHIVLFISRALSGVSGAALYTVNPKLAYYAMTAVTLLNVCVGLLLHDEKVSEKTATNREHIAQTVGLMRRSEVVFSLLMAFVTFSLVAECVWTGYQLFYDADGQSALLIGSLFSIIAICSAVGAYAVRHLFGRFHPLRIIQTWGLGLLLTSILLYQPVIWLRLAAILPMGFMSGTVIAVLNATVQDIIVNRYHSTALSVINLLWFGIYGVGSISVGVLFNIFGIATTRGILLGAATVVFAIVWMRAGFLSSKAKAYRIQAAAQEPIQELFP